MARTAGTRTSRIAQLTPTGSYGTSSDLDPNSNFEDPNDLSDIAGLNADIGGSPATPPRRPPMGGGIDLGKGLDLEKPRPPRSAIGIEVGKSPQGNLGIGVEVPIGLSPFGARGGLSIDPATGKIRGGYGGLGIGKGPIGASIDVGVDTPPGSDEFGCYKYVTVSLGVFSHTYGKNDCEPKIPAPGLGSAPSPTPTPIPPAPDFQRCEGFVWQLYTVALMENSPITGLGKYKFNDGRAVTNDYANGYEETWLAESNYLLTGIYGAGNYVIKNKTASTTRIYRTSNYAQDYGNISYPVPSGNSPYSPYNYIEYTVNLRLTKHVTFLTENPNKNIPIYEREYEFPDYTGCYSIGFGGTLIKVETTLVSVEFPPCPEPAPTPTPTPVSLPPYSPPLPNSPPRKRKMDDKCCRAILLMLQMQHKHLGVSPIPGMESLNQFAKVVPKGEVFQGEQMVFPFEVPKVWLDPIAKKEDKILVKNISELLFIMGSQTERLERILGTKEFIKDSEGKLRQSEGNLFSWLSGKNPDFAYPDPNDFWANSDDGIIKEKRLEIHNLSDAIRYVVEMGNRLERILPIAELKDSSIPKRWIYPGAKGQERVGNLIHLIELMVRSDDKSRGYWPIKVKVKDADPAIKGDQPIELEFHSQADVFRELFQFLIDMEGDGDMSSNFALRSAFQACQMHQLTVQNNAMLDAIVEYLDFKVNKTTAKVPMPFNPFAGMSPSLVDKALEKLGIIDGTPLTPSINSNKEADIEALAPSVLQNTVVDVDIIECDENKTLNESLLELLKHSSAASAAVSERVSETAIDRVVTGASLAQKLTAFLLRRDVAAALGIGDLDKWVNSAELGYTDFPESQGLRFPESDPLEPYGRPAAENPKIREIDTKEPKAD